MTTDAGSWVAPATRALWVPAGTVHAHQAHGDLELHLVGLPARENPLRLDGPAVLAVSPLLRELIMAHTRSEDHGSPEARRLRGVLLDQLRVSVQQPLHLPRRTIRCCAGSATCCAPIPRTTAPSPSWAGRSERATARCPACSARISG